jgi:hypothetical protein
MNSLEKQLLHGFALIGMPVSALRQFLGGCAQCLMSAPRTSERSKHSEYAAFRRKQK